MKSLQNRLVYLEKSVNSEKITIMIIGLGSVGAYLLDYLISTSDSSITVVVVGRDAEKMQTKVNIARVAGLIRGVNRSRIVVEGGVDLNDIDGIKTTIEKYQPDFIVNSSRAYPGLKYGSISWTNIRAYGIWTPLAIRFTRNIMEACDRADTNALVINTSYSDAVIPWLKSAGKAYPDFGSGNLNHLIPRIQFAVAEMLSVPDFWNIDVMFAAGHFHDVCISKEGHTEGIELPLKVFYKGMETDLPHDKIFSACKIPMPTDQTRNMMNASSNYQIIISIVNAFRTGKVQKLFVPGFGGNIGGYPVRVGYIDGKPDAWIDESIFSFDEMNKANKTSMALDGVEDIVGGSLVYTDDLIKRTKKAFGVDLPKTVAYTDIEKTANYIIDNIILPHTKQRG